VFFSQPPIDIEFVTAAAAAEAAIGFNDNTLACLTWRNVRCVTTERAAKRADRLQYSIGRQPG